MNAKQISLVAFLIMAVMLSACGNKASMPESNSGHFFGKAEDDPVTIAKADGINEQTRHELSMNQLEEQAELEILRQSSQYAPLVAASRYQVDQRRLEAETKAHEEGLEEDLRVKRGRNTILILIGFVVALFLVWELLLKRLYNAWKTRNIATIPVGNGVLAVVNDRPYLASPFGTTAIALDSMEQVSVPPEVAAAIANAITEATIARRQVALPEIKITRNDNTTVVDETGRQDRKGQLVRLRRN